ncbi:ATP-binding protein [Streptomyces sp. NPDC054797]
MTTLSSERTAFGALSDVAEARQSARSFLDALGPSGIDPECPGSVVLVVSELVTNALLQGSGTCTLRLSAHPDVMEVAAEDPSPTLPRMRTRDLIDGTGGFGLHMVNDLPRATFVTPTPEGGKTVRALLPRG